MSSRFRLVASVESSEGRAGGANGPEPPLRWEVTDLGGGSEVVHVSRFVSRETAWEWFDCLHKNIPWTRPTIRVFGRSTLQPRDTCYVAEKDLTNLKYSGHQPHTHSWDEFPVLKDILKAVHEALPSSYFNSLLLNRCNNGSDYVSWHADDELLYGPTPEIASVSLGCERQFLLRKKPKKSRAALGSGEGAQKRQKVTQQQHSLLLKHGSLLVMRGYTQRDWHHSVPKRALRGSISLSDAC